MDHIDTKILRCLAQDARMNASQISAQVNLSVSAVIERMKKLESSGLIRGYTAVIDERLAGYDVQALISSVWNIPSTTRASPSRCATIAVSWNVSTSPVILTISPGSPPVPQRS